MPTPQPRPAACRKAAFRIQLACALISLAGCGGGEAPGVAAAEASQAAQAAQAAGAPGVGSTGPAAGLAFALASTGTPAGERVPVVIRAAGGVVNGVAVEGRVRYNGTVVAAGAVASAAMTDYVFELPGPLRGGALDIVMVNADEAAGTATRVLRIASVTVAGIVLRPTDFNAVFDAGNDEAAFDGLQVSAGRALLANNGALRLTLPTADEVARAQQPLPDTPGVYIDAERGSDDSAGTQERPWRTIARLATSSARTSGNIFLRCGTVFRESLSIREEWLKPGRLIAGYGPECPRRKAVISGADDFSGGWQQSGGVWSRALPRNTPKISQLFIDGSPLRTARWPNLEGTSARKTALASAGLAADHLAVRSEDASALSTRSLVGAAVQLRTQAWLIESRVVVGTRQDALALDRPLDWKLDPGEGYVLSDKLWMLDEAGEFFHDLENQRLYFVAPAHSPADLNTALIEGSVRDVGLVVQNSHGTVVRDVALVANRADGLHALDAPGLQVSDVVASDNGSSGIRLRQWAPEPAQNARVEVSGSLVTDNGHYGIDAGYVRNARISGNRVLQTGIGSHRTEGVYAAIETGPGGQVEDNLIDGSGYLGIRFSSRDNSRVSGNRVNGHCQRLSDCAGIYTWSQPHAQQASQRSVVEGNQVRGGEANLTGTQSAGSDLVAGIYIDDESDGVVVRGNLLAQNPFGIFVHNASRLTVENNRVWLPGRAGIAAAMDRHDADRMTDNLFQGNEIVPLVQVRARPDGPPGFSVGQPFWLYHALTGKSALAERGNVFRDNRVLNLQGLQATHATVLGPAGQTVLDADEWSRLNRGEPAPSQPSTFQPYELVLGPELIADAEMDQGLNTWRSWRSPASQGFGVAATSAGGCVGACLQFSTGHPGDYLASPGLMLEAGSTYLYRTRLAGATAGLKLAWPYISRDASPWDAVAEPGAAVALAPRSLRAGTFNAFEAFFVPRETAQARVHFQLEAPGTAVVDAVSVRKVMGVAAAQVDEWARIVTAPVQQSQRIGCASLQWPENCRAIDRDGTAVALPLDIPAGTARLLLRADSPHRR